MQDKYNREEYIKLKEKEKKELAEKLSVGIKNALDSDRYKDFLKVMSKCHNYSYTNSMLIYIQNENATIVKSYTDWKKDKVKVNKNEKGIKIFCPIKNHIDVYKKNNKGEFVLNENGEKIKIDEKEYTNFKIGNVFDISQTNANPENYELKIESSEKILNKNEILKKLEKLSGIKFEFSDNLGVANGIYTPDEDKIEIKADMGDIKTISTCVHEVAHSILHKKDNNSFSREQKEFEAESVAYVVCQRLNVDSKFNNLLYLANWIGKKDISEFENSLDRIQNTSNYILKEFDIPKQSKSLEQKSNEVEI